MCYITQMEAGATILTLVFFADSSPAILCLLDASRFIYGAISEMVWHTVGMSPYPLRLRGVSSLSSWGLGGVAYKSQSQ